MRLMRELSESPGSYFHAFQVTFHLHDKFHKLGQQFLTSTNFYKLIIKRAQISQKQHTRRLLKPFLNQP